MSKLSKIEIDNFRIFPAGKYSEIDISDISIITGANSSGKSSLFKALLLLQDNWYKNHLLKLDFTDRQHKLGSIKSVLNDSDKALKIKLSFDDGITLEYEFENPEGKLQSFKITDDNEENSVFKILYESKDYKIEELNIIWFEKREENNYYATEWETEIKRYLESCSNDEWNSIVEDLYYIDNLTVTKEKFQRIKNEEKEKIENYDLSDKFFFSEKDEESVINKNKSLHDKKENFGKELDVLENKIIDLEDEYEGDFDSEKAELEKKIKEIDEEIGEI